jgi:hypothetical protein
MHKLLVMALMGLTAAAQTQIDLATQAKRVDFSNASSTKPLQTGTPLPSACTVGQMFFKTDAPAGANLYACTATNTWSVQGGITGTNCYADASSQTLRCQDTNGNVYTVVKTATSGTANQWVDYITANGTPHTSQPTAGAVGAVADPGNNSVPYRSGVGTATAASADQMSGPFFCQDAGTSGAYSCSLTPAIVGYTAGTTYWFRANTANTGSATLSLNALGAKTIVKQANQGLAANDIRAGQWVMVTYDGSNMQMQSQTGNASGSVSAVFGRAGAVTAQTGDYAFTQIGGTASAAQLPAVAMRTDQGNAVTAGTQDFSQSAHTLPMKSGSAAAMPSTCSMGETYFATDVAAGNNFFGCTAANVWSQQAGSTFAFKANGTPVGLRNTLNLIPGLGLAPIVTDTGSQINFQIPIDTAVTDTRLNAASGADLLVTPTSNSGTAYAGCPSGLTPPVTAGMVVHLVPDHSSTGGATTFNYCATSAAGLKEADGASNLTSTDLVAGRQQDIWYDGTQWRLKTSASSGSMTWPSSAGVTVYGGSNAWGSSLPVGTSANNLVQLNGSGQLPAVSAALLTSFPTLNQSTSGNAATATALASTPAQCTSGQYATGVTAAGTANCAQVAYSQVSSTPTIPTASSATPIIDGTAAAGTGTTWARADHVHPTDTSRQAAITGAPSTWPTLGTAASVNTGTSSGNVPVLNGAGALTVPTTGNAATATALASAPAQCSGGQYATGVAAAGTANCAQVAYSQVSSTPSLGTAASVNTGTSGATIPLLNGTNAWSSAQTFSSTLNKITLTAPTTAWTIQAAADNQTTTIPAGTLINNTGSTSGNAGTATYLAGGAAGSLPYQTAAGTTGFIAGNATGNTDCVLTSTSVSGAYSATACKNAPALAATNFTGLPGTADIPAFVICTTSGCLAENTFNNYFVSAPNGITFDECGVSLATMPTVQNVIIDIQTAAGVSIFGTNKLVVHTTDAVGTTNFQATFANSPQTAAKGAQFKAVITQSDTGGAALGGYVKCRVH